MSDIDDKAIVIIGAGGHAAVLADILLAQNCHIVALVAPDLPQKRDVFASIPVFSDEVFLQHFSPNDAVLVNGIGQLPYSTLRQKIFEEYQSKGFQFRTIIADTAFVSAWASIQEGGQVLPHAVVQTGALIGMNTVINTGAIVEHDCHIAAHNHVAPRSVLCGDVSSGQGVYIGAGAIIIQGVEIEENAIIGAGSIITEHVPSQHITYPYRSPILKHS